MAVASSRVCKARKRNSVTGENETCELPILRDECSGRAEHVRNMKTGYCANGWCEGIKAVSFQGTPCPTCKFWLHCPCSCHDLVTQMFIVQERPRQLLENSEYKPIRTFSILTLEERAAAKAKRRSEERLVRLNEASLFSKSNSVHSLSGRTRRGLLDQWVELQCKLWLLDSSSKDCTPSWISEHIAMCEDVPAPSVGAIDAVLKRWIEIGFAEIAKKPARFVSFTAEGKRLGLDVLKEKYKLETRRLQTVSRRGFR